MSQKTFRTWRGATLAACGLAVCGLALVVYFLSCDKPERPEVDRRAAFTLQGHTLSVEQLAFSPDGTVLASGSNDGTVRLWRVRNGRHLATLDQKEQVTSLAFRQQGRYLLVSCNDQTIREWDLIDYHLHATLETHSVGGIQHLALSPDETKVAVVAGPLISGFTLFNWERKAPELFLEGHPRWTKTVCYSPDGKTLLTKGGDGTARVWEVATGKERRDLRRESSIYPVTYLPDGTIAIPENAGTTFHPDGTLATPPSNRIVLWDLSGNKRAAVPSPEGGVHAVVGSPDGKYLIWLSGGSLKWLIGPPKPTLSIWNLTTLRLEVSLVPHSSGGTALAISPQGDFIATSCMDSGKVKLWKMSDLLEVQ